MTVETNTTRYADDTDDATVSVVFDFARSCGHLSHQEVVVLPLELSTPDSFIIPCPVDGSDTLVTKSLL